MKKTLIQTFIISLFFISFNAIAEIKHIKEGNVDAKVKLVVFESLTCSHCGDFHKNIYPKLKTFEGEFKQIKENKINNATKSKNINKIKNIKNDKIKQSLLELNKIFKTR